MNLPFHIARRYLFAHKSSNAINVIIWISIGGIAVCTAALIIVLSVFNGLSHFIEDLFSVFDPDIKIVAAQGHWIPDNEEVYAELLAHPDIAAISRSVQSKVLLSYVDQYTIGTLKGVDDQFTDVSPLDSSEYLYEGSYNLEQRSGVYQAVMGSIIGHKLIADRYDENRPIEVMYIPQGKDASFSNLSRNLRTSSIFPVGYFAVQKEYDEQFVVADFDFVRDFLDIGPQISAYELRLYDIDRVEAVKEMLGKSLGPTYKVLSWYEQHNTLYQVMKNEKYISYLIVTLMLALVAVNIVGSLSMIVLEKKRDIAVLKSMGADYQLVRHIFIMEGLLVGAWGLGIGMSVALLFGALQHYFGLIKLQGGDSFKVQAFPISMELPDFMLVFVTVLALTVFASLYPSRKAAEIEVVEGLRR